MTILAFLVTVVSAKWWRECPCHGQRSNTRTMSKNIFAWPHIYCHSLPRAGGKSWRGYIWQSEHIIVCCDLFYTSKAYFILLKCQSITSTWIVNVKINILVSLVTVVMFCTYFNVMLKIQKSNCFPVYSSDPDSHWQQKIFCLLRRCVFGKAQSRRRNTQLSQFDRLSIGMPSKGRNLFRKIACYCFILRRRCETVQYASYAW